MRKQESAASSHAGWVVEYHEEYLVELGAKSEAAQDAVFTGAEVLRHAGPQLGRPYADTLNGSVSEYEGVADHVAGWRVAGCVCFRSKAKGDFAMRRQ
jgi:hypothetical protein